LVLLAEKDHYRRQRIAAITRAYLTQRPRNCRPRGRALQNADAPRINNASTVDTAVGTRPTRQRLTLARLLSDHHHFFFEDTGQLLDIPGEYVTVSGLPKPPTGAAIRRIDMIIRVDRDPAPAAD
jgi:hypothetical protein